MARLLIADDERGLRTFLETALQSAGHDVTIAVDGSDALAKLAANEFDVVLSDVRMPGMDGMAILQHVKAEHPSTQVILLTAHATVATAVEAMRLGAYDYLEKPLPSPAELRLVVARAVERRTLLNFREGVHRQGDGAPALTFAASAMVRAVEMLGKVAPTEATVLLLGESGVGKEVAAHQVHRQSARAAGPFVALNCAALSDTLLESELFGYEKGAFTGAIAQRRGRLEHAAGGTFFLDEIGELKFELQAKLLRVLQDRTFQRVGGHRSITADVRWIAATNCDLPAMVKDGSFREDLFHRLAVFPIELPPLRERQDDILPLARALLQDICAQQARPTMQLAPAAEAALVAYRWPGNIRELRNALERAVILGDGPRVEARDLPRVGAADAPVEGPLSLDVVEREAIVRALAGTQGNRRRAAHALGIGLRTLYDKLKRYDL